MKGFFSVKNFERYQHYKDRSPPWIKLYNDLLDDYEFGILPDASKFHIIAIGLLASRTSNRIPADAGWVARKIGATTTVDLTMLAKSGFIILDQISSDMLAPRLQDAMPETERETEVETERETESICAKPADAVPALAPVPDFVIPAFLVRTADPPPPVIPEKPAKPPAVIEPAWIEIPTSSWDTKQEAVPITESKIAEYEATYPGVDVRQQLRAMRQWSFDNRPKRKTKTGMLKFINAWLAREQDRPKGDRPNAESFGAAKNRRFLTGFARAAARFTENGPAEGEDDNRAPGKTGDSS